MQQTRLGSQSHHCAVLPVFLFTPAHLGGYGFSPQSITLYIAGSGASLLVEARASGVAIEALPAAANLFRLPATLRSLPPRPVYVRAPDAKAKVAA